MAFGLQALHHFGRQHDDVRRLAGPHQFRRVDAAHGADLDGHARLRLVVARQISQDTPGRHGRETNESPAHVTAQSVLASPHGGDGRLESSRPSKLAPPPAKAQSGDDGYYRTGAA